MSKSEADGERVSKENIAQKVSKDWEERVYK